jgi:transposase
VIVSSPPCRRQRLHFASPPWQPAFPHWQLLDQQLPPDHHARLIVRAIASLDLRPLTDSYAGRGSLPYPPGFMLRIALIEIHEGKHSPTQWWRDTRRDQVLQWAGYGIRPSRSCWYRFHHRLAPLLDAFNRQVLQLAQQQRQLTGARASLDGSTVAANASRHRLLNAERLDQRQQQLAQPPDPPPAWMARSPRGRAAQRRRYEQARARLDQRLAANARRNPAKRQNPKKIVVSGTDPEAALGLDKNKVFRPLYNVQLLDDLDSPFLLGYDVLAQPTDAGALAPLLDRGRQLLGHVPSVVLADATYVSGADLATAARRGVTLYGPWLENDYTDKQAPSKIGKEQFVWLPQEQAYRCPQGQLLTHIGQEKRQRADGQVDLLHKYRCAPRHCRACPLRAACTSSPERGRSVKRSEHEELIEVHKARMATAEAKALYKLRRQTVELGFADLKEHRRLRRFWGRGIARARATVALAVLVHNLRALHCAPRIKRETVTLVKNGP